MKYSAKILLSVMIAWTDPNVVLTKLDVFAVVMGKWHMAHQTKPYEF